MNAPLVERKDIPNHALHKNLVLIERNQLPETFRREPLRQKRIRRAVARKRFVRHPFFRHAFGATFIRRFSKGQRFRLREEIAHQFGMMIPHRVVRLAKADEITRNQLGALMNQLIKRMLPVRARLPPHDRPGGICHHLAVFRDALAVAFHVALLEIRGEPRQILVIRQQRRALRAKEIAIPNPQQRQNHRHVFLKRCRRKMAVHGMKAIQHAHKVFRTNRNHQRQPDGGSQRITPADPIPKLKHVGGINPERLNFPLGRGNRHKVTRHRRRIAQLPHKPIPRRGRVGHRFLRGERLGRDNKKRLCRVQIAGGLGQMRAIHIGHKAHRQVAPAKRLQRLIRHRRPQIAAPDANVDNVANGLAREAQPVTGAHARGKRAHLVQHRTNRWHHILTIHRNGRVGAIAQRNVQHRAVFRLVDFLPGKHRLDFIAQTGNARQRLQQPHRLGGNQVFGIIQIPRTHFEAERCPARGVFGKQRPHGRRLHDGSVLLQRLPFGGGVESFAPGHDSS